MSMIDKMRARQNGNGHLLASGPKPGAGKPGAPPVVSSEVITAREQDQQAESQGRRAAAPPKRRNLPTPAEHDANHRRRGRLPNGARFEVVYDDARRTWSGTLVAGQVRVEGKSGGVFRSWGCSTRNTGTRSRRPSDHERPPP
jgi:hypothetical protein